MWLFLVCVLVASASAHYKICVPESLSSSCAEMQRDLSDHFQCVVEPDTFRCVQKVSLGEADFTNVDPSGLYLAGKFFDLRPILTELVDGEVFRYQGIALVRKESDIQSASDLRHRSSCHTGFKRTVGWKIPVGRLLSGDVMAPDCENGDLGAVQNFFNGSCVPGKWSPDPEVDAALKRKFGSLCSKCKDPSACAADDEYAGYLGVMKCLSEGAADVAFTKIHKLKEYLKDHPEFEDEAELLCFEGGRQSVRTENPCVWGHRHTNAFVARKGNDDETEKIIAAMLETQTRYSVPQSRKPEWYFKTFLSHPDGTGIQRTEESRNTYDTYLGDFLHSIRPPRRGCEGRKDGDVTVCVTSAAERNKCEDFAWSAESLGIWPDVSCAVTSSKTACMQAVQEDNTQLLVLDGGDVYKAGRYYGLQPVASELYDGSDATYYAVAVMRLSSDVTEMSQLRGLRSCHTGMGRTAGWVMPVGVMVSEGLLSTTNGSCNHAEGVADFFSEGSCVPGANDTKSNPDRVRSQDLCRHCVGDELGQHKCARDANERYSGYAGAFRCLAEGAGDVAFVKHKTVPDYTDGKGKEDWTKDLISSDYHLLCDGGGTAPVSEYERCNLGKVPSHQVVTGDIGESRHLNIAMMLADLSKQLSGNSTFFQLFGPGRLADLVFKDSATGLKVLPLSSTYEQVLGQRFLEASRIADPKNCAPSA